MKSLSDRNVVGAIAVATIHWNIMGWLLLLAAIFHVGRAYLMYRVYRRVRSSTERVFYSRIYICDILICVALGSSSVLFLLGIAGEWVLLVGGGATIACKVVQIRLACRVRRLDG